MGNNANLSFGNGLLEFPSIQALLHRSNLTRLQTAFNEHNQTPVPILIAKNIKDERYFMAVI